MAKTKYIETPEDLWDYFKGYRKELEENPINIVEQKKGNSTFKITAGAEGKVNFEAPSDIVLLPHKRPLTLEGFENWCADNDIINDLGDYFKNKDQRYTEYAPICLRIKRTIRQDQIEGGMVGIYNPSITQRLNNLVEKVETDNKTTFTGLNIQVNKSGLPPATSEKHYIDNE